jgi:hypothetical protein
VARRKYKAPYGTFDIVTQDEGYAHLACSIVERAIEDWRAMEHNLHNGSYPAHIKVWDMGVFFNSMWFDFLSSAININPDIVRSNLSVSPRISGLVIRLSVT